MKVYPIVMHIPHASTFIPAGVRDQFILSDQELQAEIDRMTDWYTAELFEAPAGVSVERVISYVSRLVTDVERLPIDDMEPMAEHGMGMFYRMTSSGTLLRRDISVEEQHVLFETYYRPHHARLSRAVDGLLHRFGHCCVLDCHSFPKDPLPYEDARLDRPEICIGTDGCHTPDALAILALDVARRHYLEVALNMPFSGALVSGKHWCADDRVFALMVEVRRDIYLESGRLLPGAQERFQSFLAELTHAVAEFVLQQSDSR